MRKKLTIKLLIVALVLLATIGIVNVNATGYTYDHKGKVIYSTDGFTVNQTPYIYETLGIEAKMKPSTKLASSLLASTRCPCFRPLTQLSR